MPKRFKGVYLKAECGWVKFKEYEVYSDGKICYTFQCSLKPMFYHSKGTIHNVNLDEKYRIKYFDLISDSSGKNLFGLYLGNQLHPHKESKFGYLCLGKYNGMKLTKQLLPILLCCLLRYDADDCYILPDTHLENFDQP